MSEQRLFIGESSAASLKPCALGTLPTGRATRKTTARNLTPLRRCLPPIYPISQYVVRNNGGGSYTFFGKVPLGRFHVRWRRLLAIGAVGGALAIAGSVAYAHRFAHVHVVNGLDVPVVVTMGKTTVRVPSQGESPQRFERGPYHVAVALEGGRVIEEVDVDGPGNVDLSRTTCPARRRSTPRRPSTRPELVTTLKDDAQHEIYAGKNLVSRDHVDTLTTPPQNIQMDESSGVTRRWYVGTEGGWMNAAAYLAGRGTPDAAKVARAVRSPSRRTRRDAARAHSRRSRGMTRRSRTHARSRALAPDAVEPFARSDEARYGRLTRPARSPRRTLRTESAGGSTSRRASRRPAPRSRVSAPRGRTPRTSSSLTATRVSRPGQVRESLPEGRSLSIPTLRQRRLRLRSARSCHRARSRRGGGREIALRCGTPSSKFLISRKSSTPSLKVERREKADSAAGSGSAEPAARRWRVRCSPRGRVRSRAIREGDARAAAAAIEILLATESGPRRRRGARVGRPARGAPMTCGRRQFLLALE